MIPISRCVFLKGDNKGYHSDNEQMIHTINVALHEWHLSKPYRIEGSIFAGQKVGRALFELGCPELVTLLSLRVVRDALSLSFNEVTQGARRKLDPGKAHEFVLYATAQVIGFLAGEEGMEEHRQVLILNELQAVKDTLLSWTATEDDLAFTVHIAEDRAGREPLIELLSRCSCLLQEHVLY
jgi:hypothetical protein